MTDGRVRAGAALLAAGVALSYVHVFLGGEALLALGLSLGAIGTLVIVLGVRR